MVLPSSMKHRHQQMIAWTVPLPPASTGNRTSRLRPSGPGSGRPCAEKSKSNALTEGERGRNLERTDTGVAVPGQRIQFSEDGGTTALPPLLSMVGGRRRLMLWSSELSQQKAQTSAECGMETYSGRSKRAWASRSVGRIPSSSRPYDFRSKPPRRLG